MMRSTLTPVFIISIGFYSIRHSSDCQGRPRRITVKVVLDVPSFLTTQKDGQRRCRPPADGTSVTSPRFRIRRIELLPSGPQTHPSFQPHANVLSHSIFGCSSGSNRGHGSHPRLPVLPSHTWRHSNPLPVGFNWVSFQGGKGTSTHCCCHGNCPAGILCVHVPVGFSTKSLRLHAGSLPVSCWRCTVTSGLLFSPQVAGRCPCLRYVLSPHGLTSSALEQDSRR